MVKISNNTYKKISTIKSQDEAVDFLRKSGYRFCLLSIHLEKTIFGQLPKLNPNVWSFMSNPKPGGPHPMFGFRFNSKSGSTIIVWWGKGKVEKLRDIPWKSTHNFKKVTYRWKFPKEMTYQQREVFRLIHADWESKNKNPKNNDFYMEWLVKVKPLNPHISFPVNLGL